MSSPKRAVDEKEARSPRKRPKISDEVDILNEPLPNRLEPDLIKENHIFRFLDLPGELRNRIYEIAAELTERNFPPTIANPNQKPTKRKRSPKSQSSPSEKELPSRRSPPLPFLSLTQVCSLIRTEFRPLWLSSHCFPLAVIDGYLKAFLPTRLPHADAKRFDSFFDPVGRLCLQVQKYSHSAHGLELLKLLRFKARFPLYTLNLVSDPSDYVNGRDLEMLSFFINNTNPTWVKWVKGNALSQVRMKIERNWIRMVVKEKFAPVWMRPMLEFSTMASDEFFESLGLNNLPTLKMCFGVDYS